MQYNKLINTYPILTLIDFIIKKDIISIINII